MVLANVAELDEMLDGVVVTLVRNNKSFYFKRFNGIWNCRTPGHRKHWYGSRDLIRIANGKEITVVDNSDGQW